MPLKRRVSARNFTLSLNLCDLSRTLSLSLSRFFVRISYPFACVCTNQKFSLNYDQLTDSCLNIKGKAIPVTDRGGPQGCETSRLPYFIDSRLTDGGEGACEMFTRDNTTLNPLMTESCTIIFKNSVPTSQKHTVSITKIGSFWPWHNSRRLFTGFSPRRPEFNPKSVHVVYVAYKVALDQILS
jgi:hypothetical protein